MFYYDFLRPNVYVVSEKMYEEYKQKKVDAEVKELDAEIERLEARVGRLKKKKEDLLVS